MVLFCDPHIRFHDPADLVGEGMRLEKLKAGRIVGFAEASVTELAAEGRCPERRLEAGQRVTGFGHDEITDFLRVVGRIDAHLGKALGDQRP